MSDMSTYVGDKLLNWIKGTAMGTAPTSVTVALFNGDPDSGGTELTGTINLARQTVAFGSVAARSMSNNAEVNFGTANNTGTATYVVIYDQGTNQLGKKSIASASISSGEKVAIAAAALVLSY